MKKTVLMSAAKKARIALAVLAVCGFTLAGAQSAFAENVTIDINKNIICGDGAKAEYEPHRPTNNAIVIGTSAIGKGDEVIVLGKGAIVGDYYGIAIGSASEAKGNYTVAIGYSSIASVYATAVGYKAQASGAYATAFGEEARAIGVGSVAVGLWAGAEGNDSSVLGAHTYAKGQRSTALGWGTQTTEEGKSSVALGYGSVADEENVISVGRGERSGWCDIYTGVIEPAYRRIVNVADGTKNTDAATFGQIIKAGEYNLTLDADGSGQVTLQTNAGANGPTIKVNASALAGGGSTLTQEQFNDMLDANTKFTGLQTEVGNKANANGDNITTGEGSQWADKLGTGAIENGNNNLVNGGTVYNKIGDTSQLADANLGNNLSNAVMTVNNKVEAAQTTATDALNKANTNATKIGDTGKLTTAGLGSNLSEAVVNVNNKVGTADELKALKDAGLGDNLAQATAAVNKKADKNAEDINKVNGRVDELGGRVDTLGGAVSKLDTKVNKVGAGAAALAALHPMEFDSDNKLTFAAGVGSYHGASAAAIGAFYRPSEQVMFSIAGNMGNGENMVNAGVSFALDRPSKTPTTKAALVKTVAAQNEQIAALNETLAEQNEKIARLEAMVEKLAAKQNA